MFNDNEYRKRSLIEGIFGAEETRGHQLLCRFVREDNRRRFSKGRAIAWNIRVPQPVSVRQPAKDTDTILQWSGARGMRLMIRTRRN